MLRFEPWKIALVAIVTLIGDTFHTLTRNADGETFTAAPSFTVAAGINAVGEHGKTLRLTDDPRGGFWTCYVTDPGGMLALRHYESSTQFTDYVSSHPSSIGVTTKTIRLRGE